MELNKIVEESMKIREAYHALEEKHHGRKWNIQEDALAMSTDVGLISRLIMDEASIWPTKKDDTYNLEYKIGEVVWWLSVISDKSDIDLSKAVENFIQKKQNDFNIE
ncbi:MazG-like protein [Staphylococcus edaphicus]|uniref:MazG-like protein n=1 Tax=Staphylococcus edaphicus TaxID=1955013 RepID=A0A2C6WMH6_9STAP|nr:MazG-like protein [Staphylococcus edaphicus]PHK48647.1 MazG-like protein [Staphylococcus edaphicus]UQW80942.1 MazG-like protein [Staphylococcus edaphicus]